MANELGKLSDAELQSLLSESEAAPTAPAASDLSSLSDEDLAKELAATATPQAPEQFQMPQSLNQQVISPTRAIQSVISGAIAVPKGAAQLLDLAQGIDPNLQPPKVPGVDLPQESLLQTAGRSLGGPENLVGGSLGFEAKTPVEMGGEVLGGLPQMAIESAIGASQAAKAVKEARRFDYAAAPTISEIASTMETLGLKEAPLPKVTVRGAKDLRLVTPELKSVGDTEIRLAELRKELAKAQEAENEAAALIQTRRDAGLPTNDLEEEFYLRRKNTLEKTKQEYDLLNQPRLIELDEAKKFFSEQELEGAPILQKKISSQGVIIPNQEVRELVNTQDLSTLEKATTWSKDPMRVAAQVDNFNPEGLMQATVRKISEAEAASTLEKDQILGAFTQQMQDLGIDRNNSERMKTLAQYAEKRLGPDEIMAAKVTDNELKWINSTKKQYNELLERINASRTKYGLKPIKKRQDYITHIMSEEILRHMNLPEDAPTLWQKMGKGLGFRFGKARTNAIGAQNIADSFEAYIPAAMKQIHLTGPVAELEARTALLKPAAQKYFNEYSHILKGGRDLKNQAVQAILGKQLTQHISDIVGLTSRSVIEGSVNVFLQQPAQMLETLARTGLRSTIKGTLASLTREIPAHLQQYAPSVVRRSVAQDLTVNPSILKRADKFLNATLGAGDKFFAKQTWWAAFEKYTAQGYSEQTAARLANDMSRMLHADYREIMRAGITRGPVGRAVQPLANFAYNLWNHISQDPKLLKQLNNTSRVRELVTTIGSMIAVNQMYEFAGIPGPFQVSLPQGTTPGDIKQSATETARLYPPASFYQFGATPLAAKASGVSPDEMSKNMELTMTAFFHEDEDIQKEAWTKLAKKPLGLAPGGRQIKNIWEGINAVRDGYVNVGNEEIEVEGFDKVLAPLIGPNQLKKVRNERKRQAVEKINSKLGIE